MTVQCCPNCGHRLNAVALRKELQDLEEELALAKDVQMSGNQLLRKQWAQKRIEELRLWQAWSQELVMEEMVRPSEKA